MRHWKVPNTYTIIFSLIILSAIATWMVPGGAYVTRPDGTLVYEEMAATPQSLSVFAALYHGFVKQAGIIVFILIVGGAFWLLGSTGAITAGISRFIEKVGQYDKIVLAAIALLFSLAGAVFGMSEETIPFVGIVVPLVISMGYDAFLGMLIVYVAANIGFSSAFLNPFTVGIAQEMAGLPLFSGMNYRIVCWAGLTTLLLGYVFWYARSCKEKDRGMTEDGGMIAQSLHDNRNGCLDEASQKQEAAPFTLRHKLILLALFVTVILLIVGVTCWGWYMAEISGLFLAMGLVCGGIAGYDANRITNEMMAGAKDILSSAMVVGLASGIIVILQDGHIIDSILHTMQTALSDTGKDSSLVAMYGIQTVINTVIPSATAKAAITIPIMAPFSDMVGVSRQAMVLAFQFGDGFTNMITPTSGVLIASLSMAHITYTEWIRKVWKPVLVLLIIGVLLLMPTTMFAF